MITKINKLSDVEDFAKNLVAEGTNFHPDDDFSEIVSVSDNKPAYSAKEAKLRNELMVECHRVCQENGLDAYEYLLEIYLRETKLDKFIPRPSQLN